MLGQTLGQSGQVQPRYLDFLHSLCSNGESAHQWGTSTPLGSLESNWVLWKASLSLLSWVSIFNLEEKKITALLFGCIKIYGAGWFPGGCYCRALLWWWMTATCHQCSRALVLHCSNESFVIHHCLDSCPRPGLACTLRQGALAQNKPVFLLYPTRPPHLPRISYCWQEGRKIVFSSELHWSIKTFKGKGSIYADATRY